MTRHNKKRNTGLIYEFLVRTVSDSLIEGNDKRRDTALNILRTNFKRNTELYKEFRLFHSLVATTVKNESVADKIINAAKQESKNYNDEKLDYEKSLLIRSINHNLSKKVFYDRRIPEYKIYATIQSLLNEWRVSSSDIVQVAQYEEQLKEWLLSEKIIPTLDEEAISAADPLVEKLMIKKLNDKYYNNLSEEQIKLIKTYVFSQESDENRERLHEHISLIKKDTLEKIDVYLSENKGKNKYVEEKLSKAKDLILAENIEDITDSTVEKFLDVTKLKEEIA